MSHLFCDTPMNYMDVIFKKVDYTPVRAELDIST